MTENILSELELHTMGDISRQRDVVLVAFTPKLGRFLLRMSLGIDSSEGCESECGGGDDEEEDELQKSIGAMGRAHVCLFVLIHTLVVFVAHILSCGGTYHLV